MLSRTSHLSALKIHPFIPYILRTRTSCATSPPQSESLPNRLVRSEPGKVRFAFIPEEWFTFFYEKTGVTGPYTFAVTFTTYLFSKEHYVMEHEYYAGLSLGIMYWAGIKYLGPGLAKALDKEIDEYEFQWNETRDSHKREIQETIENEEKNQWSFEGQLMICDVKRENVALQLEAEYRSRLDYAYREVKRRLDYQVRLADVEKNFVQRNLVDWVVRQVYASYTPELEKENIESCLNALEGMAANYKATV